jgi:hypothetical protein
MDPDVADFIEQSVEDLEFDGFSGLRCVERRHLVVVKLRSLLPDVIQPIGLPAHTEFSCCEGKDMLRHFRWLTTKQCKERGVKIDEKGVLVNLRADVRGKLLADQPNPMQALVDFLRQGGVEPDSWKDKGHGLRLLLQELATGRCFLEHSSQGLRRVVKIVSVRVWSPDHQLLLVDKGRQAAVSAKQVWRAQLPGREVDESEGLQEVALAMCEIVKLGEDDVQFPDEHIDGSCEFFDYVEPKSHFEGLVTKYQKFFVDAVLEEEDELIDRMGLSLLTKQRSEDEGQNEEQVEDEFLDDDFIDNMMEGLDAFAGAATSSLADFMTQGFSRSRPADDFSRTRSQSEPYEPQSASSVRPSSRAIRFE